MTKLNFQGISPDSVYFLRLLFLCECLMYVILNDQTDDLKKN